MGNLNRFEIPQYTDNQGLLEKIAQHNQKVAKTGKEKMIFYSAFIDLNSVIELPNKQKLCNSCNFRCPGCFKLTDEIENTDYLEFSEIKKIIDFAKQRKCVSITIAGAGEPLMDKAFPKLLAYANKKGLTVNLFTNGTLIDKKTAKKLFKSKTNVIVKRNTMNETKQDYLVGNIKGASKKIQEGINNLLEAGFSTPRLVIDSYISKQNKEDLADLLRYCRKNKITPYFEAFVTAGQEKTRYKNKVLSQKEFNTLFKELRKIDAEEFQIKTKIEKNQRAYGQHPCTKNQTMFSVRTNGSVTLCVSNPDTIGNIREQTLQDIFNPNKNNKLKKAYSVACKCSMKIT